MSNFIVSQFEQTYNGLMDEIEGLDEKQLDIQPSGFNNTIRWQIGHLLTVNEQGLFGFPNDSEHLPKRYENLFASGTKPADWPADVPSLSELTEQLTNQLERIKQIPAEKFEEKLPESMWGATTYGELAAVVAYHEGYHIGQIYAMKKLLTK